MNFCRKTKTNEKVFFDLFSIVVHVFQIGLCDDAFPEQEAFELLLII